MYCKALDVIWRSRADAQPFRIPTSRIVTSEPTRMLLSLIPSIRWLSVNKKGVQKGDSV